MTERGPITQIGWDRPRPNTQNEDRSRWYGIRPGDTVGYWLADGGESGLVVVELHTLDNNGCTVRRRNGQKFKIACEWLTIERRVEDALR